MLHKLIMLYRSLSLDSSPGGVPSDDLLLFLWQIRDNYVLSDAMLVVLSSSSS